MDVSTLLLVIQIILILLNACLIPILNMWVENKIGKVKEELKNEYFSAKEAKFLVEKIDELTDSVKTMNKFLLDNWSKK